MTIDAAALASHRRAGTFARRKARTRQRDYLRRGWRVLLPLYLGLVTCAAWPALVVPNSFVRGLVLGLALAGAAGAMAALVIIQTGTGPTMAGELAEQWTVYELEDLPQHGFRLVNHVVVDGRGDADHVLVGPAGLFVLETKWSADPFEPDGERARSAADRVARRANTARLRFKRLGVTTATPVLVLWGPAARELVAGTGVARHGQTFVVAGSHLRRWLLGRAGGQLDAPTVQKVHGELATLAAQTDRLEEPVPAGVEQLAVRGVRLAALATGAFLAPWFAAVHVHPAAVLAAPLLLVVCMLPTGWRPLAAPRAVAVGAGLSSLLAAGAYLLDSIRA